VHKQSKRVREQYESVGSDHSESYKGITLDPYQWLFLGNFYGSPVISTSRIT